MSRSRYEVLADRIATYDVLVEIGIGNRTDVAETLRDRGCTVVATDLEQCAVPAGVQFVQDDVTDPDFAVYANVDAFYALNLPPELHRPAFACARTHDVPFLFTTLGGEQPLIPVRRETLSRTTLFVADASVPR